MFERHFEKMRRSRYIAGMRARGRDEAEPFQGDPISELIEECADGCNYNDAAFEAKRYERWRYSAIEYHLHQAAWLAAGAAEDAGG
jgi:hypothetical protein